MGGGIREKQAAEFTKWIDEGGKKSLFEIDADKEPVIVVGDLNVRFRGEQEGKLVIRLQVISLTVEFDCPFHGTHSPRERRM